MTTVANVRPQENGHWYDRSGNPRYEVPKKDGSGMRATTIADAKKNDWLPSVTHILKILDKPALTAWKNEQVALAVLTTPRLKDEELDAFVYRVLHVEAVQEQERDTAAARGREIHDALEHLMLKDGVPLKSHLVPWVMPVFEYICRSGKVVGAEKILVGKDYAGQADIILEGKDYWRIWDYKCTKKLPPKEAWPEHQLQLSGYGRAHLDGLTEKDPHRILVGNIYISTLEAGKFIVHETDDWFETYEKGFRPIVEYWYWANDLPRK